MLISTNFMASNSRCSSCAIFMVLPAASTHRGASAIMQIIALSHVARTRKTPAKDTVEICHMFGQNLGSWDILGYLGIGFCSASFFLSKCLISVPRKRPRKRPTFFTYLQPVLLPHFFQWTFAPPPLRHSTWHTNDTKKCTKMAKVWKNMKLCWPLAGFTKVNRTYVFFEMAEFPPKQTTTEPLTKRTRFWCYHKVLQSTRFIFFLNMSTLKLVEPGKKYPVFRWNAGWEWDTQQAGLIALYTQLRTIPYSWVQSTIDSWYPWVFSLL